MHRRYHILKKYTGPIAISLFIFLSNCNKKDNDPAPIGANQKPTANFSFSITNNGAIPCKVNFTDSSKNAGDYRWDFGDGKGSTITNPSNTYTAAKTFNVKLVVRNAYGKDSITKQVMVTVCKPKADFIFTIKNPGLLPDTVNFTSTSTGASTYTWYFDDGKKAIIANPQAIYSVAKCYNVKLVVANQAGKDSITKVVTIPLKKPVAGFNATVANTQNLPVIVTCSNTSSGSNVSYL